MIIGITGLIIAFMSFFMPIRQYIDQRRLEEKDKRFTNYHKLIEGLVDHPAGQPKLDRQIAIVFELRNYPEYFQVTVRILKGLQDSWLPTGDSVKRLITEIDLTIDYINQQQHS
jgi:hypothetical protein